MKITLRGCNGKKRDAEETAATAPYRDPQGRLVLDDIQDLPKVVEKVFAGYPEFTHTFFHESD